MRRQNRNKNRISWILFRDTGHIVSFERGSSNIFNSSTPLSSSISSPSTPSSPQQLPSPELALNILPSQGILPRQEGQELIRQDILPTSSSTATPRLPSDSSMSPALDLLFGDQESDDNFPFHFPSSSDDDDLHMI